MSSAWDASAMKAALPEQTAAHSASMNPSQDALDKWGKPLAFNYDETDAQRAEREWGGNAAVYEWEGEEGDIGPENPTLEVMLFGPPEERQSTAGLDISKIEEIRVYQEGNVRIEPIFKFQDAGLHPAMLKNVLMSGYTTPTPIQKYCIPAINMGHDLIAIAQTGSGKTAAYLVPILNQLMGKAKKLAAPRPSPREFEAGTAQFMRAEPLVLVVCPTRELAIQIFDQARKFCYRTMLRPCVVYGGGPMREQMQQIGRGCDLLIGTPGRLIDVMQRSHALSLRRLRYMVIDEADEMLEQDWQDELEKLMSGGEQDEGNVKYMLFSATFPGALRRLAKRHLAEDHLRVRVGRIGSTHANIKQDVIFVKQGLKKEALSDLIFSLSPGRTIIFVNSKRTADEVDDYLFNRGLPSTSMHADRTQSEREDAMRAFRAGKTPLLVATGVSARGIDVQNVINVINYDLPSPDHGGIQEYIHRIGRTGRIGHTGTATSFYTDRDEGIAPDLTATLMDTQQPVPDFLQQYIPDGVDPKTFKIEDDNSDDEDPSGGDGGWGGDDAPGGDGAADAGWGSESKVGSKAKAPADDGWASGGNTGGDVGGDSWGDGGGW
ncbi:DEAD-domain-containing protein [Hypoxylon cercidicola]|nr:DEAD-domain-containing protein [Hypoxylon cercidicola]